MSTLSKGQNLYANQISSRYLNLRLRYNYFRLGRTNVRHTGILAVIGQSYKNELMKFLQCHDGFLESSLNAHWCYYALLSASVQRPLTAAEIVALVYKSSATAEDGRPYFVYFRARRIFSSRYFLFTGLTVRKFWARTTLTGASSPLSGGIRTSV